MAEAVVAAVAPPVIEEDKIHTGVLLFNRWTYDEVQVIFRFTTMPLVNSLHFFSAFVWLYAFIVQICFRLFDLNLLVTSGIDIRFRYSKE